MSARGHRALPPGRSTAARSRTGGARALARGPTAAPATLLPGQPCRPSPPLSGCRRSWREERGRERMMLGFGARRRRCGFCSGDNRGRPSDRDQRLQERFAFWAGKRPMRAGRGTPRRADSAARPLAVGPRAQGKVAEQAAGWFMLLGRLNSVFVLLFFYYSRSNFNSFLNGFDHSLISIQFCTNVFIV